MKRISLIIALAAVLTLGVTLLGGLRISSRAAVHSDGAPAVYYTSIRIHEGDTLWNIAEEYAPDLGMSLDEYVDRLKQMNRLRGDTIHAGCYLTVMYSAGLR